mgnify:CR=1 FL=1
MSEARNKVESTGHKHPYHIVDPSPWPLATSASAVVAAIGAATFFHGSSWLMMGLGLAGVLLCIYLWFRDIVREATHEQAHSPLVKIGMRYGMLLFIMSEVMFFAAFFWAYFDASLFPDEAIGGIWPPEGIKMPAAFDLPFMMTMILLLSGCSATWAHHALLEGHNKDVERGLLVTVLLGVIFTGFQMYEYSHLAFGFQDTIFASTFYMATGFHGFHVLVGTIFLFVCYLRARKGHFKPDDHFGFEAAAWYWHFVDVVWLFLFVAIYWFGS